MDQNNILGIIAIIVSTIGSFIMLINNRRIRSSCCGREVSASLNIEATTPPILQSIVVPPNN